MEAVTFGDGRRQLSLAKLALDSVAALQGSVQAFGGIRHGPSDAGSGRASESLYRPPIRSFNSSNQFMTTMNRAGAGSPSKDS